MENRKAGRDREEIQLQDLVEPIVEATINAKNSKDKKMCKTLTIARLFS